MTSNRLIIKTPKDSENFPFDIPLDIILRTSNVFDINWPQEF